HISSNMLKTMKRGKGVEQLKELMTHMRNTPNSFVRTTFIVGHPGETQKEFEELCQYVKEYGFERANVFAYSDEEGTSAYESVDKIEAKVIDKRAKVLGKIIEKMSLNALKKEIGKTVDVVVDKH